MVHQLAGKRILIVEDEQMIADVLKIEITDEGGEVIGPVATVAAALDAIANADLDAVTLDIKLSSERTYSVADVLAARDIPFVFLTGYGADDVPPRQANAIRLEKPTTPAIVCRTLETLLATRSNR